MRMPRRRTAALAAVATALAVAPAALAAPASKAPQASKPEKAKPPKAPKPPKTPPPNRLVSLDLLALNDFHGNLEVIPPSSSSGRINTTPAGGAEYLAAHLDRLRAEARARGAETITVAAGDLIGASPLLSAAFHDEPSIEALNMMGLDYASVGNHEFDEGYTELLRMQNGGCLDDGDGANNQNSCPVPGAPFAGASFTYLAANTFYTGSNRTVLPPYGVTKVGGIKVAFIGLTLEDTPNIVTKSGVEGLTFTPEVATVDNLVPVLRKKGVRAIVVLLHQGGAPSDATQYDGCVGVTGPGIEIAKQLPPEVDLVVEGHTHQAYNCVIDDPAGNPRRVTSASSFGRVITNIQVTLDKRTRDVVRPSVTARNVIVTNTDTAPRADITQLISRYTALVAPIANRVLGHITPTGAVNSVTRTADADGESPLGNLIADAQRADASTIPAGGRTPQIAFMNPGGIRADLLENDAAAVTFGSAFTVQPFNNYDVSITLTGQQVLDVLNEQWNGRNEAAPKILQVSGLTYSWSRSQAALPTTDAVVAGSVMVDADANPATPMVPLDPAATYRVVVNSFLSDGGDGFATLGRGADKYYGGLDIDALATYLAANDPYTPGPTDRITAVG